MTKVITVRLSAEELAKCDAAAREMGLTRTDYVRLRLFGGENGDWPASPRFRSRDLVGAYAVGTGSANPQVRQALAKGSR